MQPAVCFCRTLLLVSFPASRSQILQQAMFPLLASSLAFLQRSPACLCLSTCKQAPFPFRRRYPIPPRFKPPLFLHDVHFLLTTCGLIGLLLSRCVILPLYLLLYVFNFSAGSAPAVSFLLSYNKISETTLQHIVLDLRRRRRRVSECQLFGN